MTERIKRHGLQVAAALGSFREAEGTTLILARQGFASWKLVGMKLPL